MASPRALRPLDDALTSSQSVLINSSRFLGEDILSAECVDGDIKGPASGRRGGQYIR
jgi:hypothetical protein